MLWTDDTLRALVAEHYAWFLPFYDHYPRNISRADVSRLFILYHYGGVYADLDILPRMSLDVFLDNEANAGVFLVRTPNMGLTNSIMISEQHHDFWVTCIMNLPR
jgi:mannosyltransferase OCH1-like enzyme